MRHSLRAAAALLVCATLAPAADYAIKTDKADAPKDLPEAALKLIGDQVVRFSDGKGKLLAELWFRKELPAKATAAQVANGLTYQEVPQTSLLGAVKVHEELGDYKKHKIKPGLYTMRLAYQPMDGDHMGTAPFAEFAILVPVKDDKGEETLTPEALHKLGSRASGTGHPAVFLLFPVAKKDLGKPPALAKREGGHWVLSVTQDVTVDGKKATIGIGMVLVGFSPSA